MGDHVWVNERRTQHKGVIREVRLNSGGSPSYRLDDYDAFVYEKELSPSNPEPEEDRRSIAVQVMAERRIGEESHELDDEPYPDTEYETASSPESEPDTDAQDFSVEGPEAMWYVYHLQICSL